MPLPLISGLLLPTLPLQTFPLPEKSTSNQQRRGGFRYSILGRGGAVLFLEESRALVESEFVRSVYEVGLLCGAVDTLPS